MKTNYQSAADCPGVLPVFPLSGALLLPRGHMPLNIFEPRYLAMVDHTIGGHRLIGMVQPDGDPESRHPKLYGVGCAGRLVQFAESGDGRYLIALAGVARFSILDELSAATPFRQCQVTFEAYEVDFQARAGEAEVDRNAVLTALRKFADFASLKVDWKAIEEASNEPLVNALSMMSPFGSREKQALLEARDLRTRAEMLVAITEMEMAKSQDGPDTMLQ